MNTPPSIDSNEIQDPETWVDQYGDYLYHFALSRVQNSFVAEDLVQETFLAALKARSSFQGRSSERTWLTGILKHKIVDFYRKSAKNQSVGDIETRRKNLDDLFEANGHWKLKPAPWTADPTKLYEQKEFMKVLYRCLAALSARLAHVFVLREMDGLKTGEICKVMDISTTNCWVMLYRARMHLRRCLETDWFAQPVPEDES